MGPRKARRPPVKERSEQIGREIEKLEAEYEKKTRRQYKTDEGFESWRSRQREKIAELKDELSVLADPSSYNEIPLAIVAEELGVTLCEMNSIASDDLVEISTQTSYFPGSRITRQELTKLYEVGAEELLRLANQELDEIFEDAVTYFHVGDTERAEKASKRMDSRVTYSSYTWVCELVLELLKGKYEDAISSIRYICRMDDLESTAILTNLGRILRGMKFKEHGAEVLREQILAITEGTKIAPWDKWYLEIGKQVGMNLDENQKRAMFLATVVKRALDRYKFTKRFRLYNSRTSEMRD